MSFMLKTLTRKGPSFGGISTPIGISLHYGKARAGLHPKRLNRQKMLFTLTFGLLVLLIQTSLEWVFFHHRLTFQESETLLIFLTVPLATTSWLIFLRRSLITGFHGAEHKVLQALENNLPLSKSAVSKQPRHYKKCGTTYAVFMYCLLAACILGTYRTLIHCYLGLGFILLAFFGSVSISLWLQKHFLTKEPTEQQFQYAITIGKELQQQILAGRNQP